MHATSPVSKGTSLFAAIAGLGLALALTGCGAGEITGEGDRQPGGDPTSDQPATPADDPFAPGLERLVRADMPIPGQYIVVMRDDLMFAAGADPQVTMADVAVSYRAKVVHTYGTALTGFVATMTEEDAIALSTDPMVAFVEEDGMVFASATQSGATWGLDRIDQRDRPLSGSYVYSGTGAGVTAYIIDTGIRISHQDFGGRAQAGYSAINDGNGANDCNGHGTHVAGTVGGSTWGVAKNVNLVAVRVLGCDGSGSNSGVIAGVDWVAANASGPSVANMSLGGGASTALDNAVKKAVQAGVVFVVAAGNENSNACNGSPSRVPEAITVGSSTSSDARSSFSNFGSCVDIFAPGSSIKSAWSTSNTATSTISGTSMASPHVAGAAALYLGANPSASPAAVTSALTGNASSGKLSGVNGSPNLLLYTGFIGGDDGGGGGGEPPPPPPPPPPPTDGTPQTGSASGSVAQGQWVNYQPLSVKAGTTITVTMSGSGDPDLYVRFGAQPTLSSWHCRPYLDGAAESCSLTVPSGQSQAYISIRGYRSGSYNLQAAWTAP